MGGVPMVQGNNVAQFKEKEDYNNWGGKNSSEEHGKMEN